MPHSFHIPVLGLGFSIDTPLKVAKYGISSVVSIVDDELVERMRCHYANKFGLTYQAISKHSHDSRAKRITGYLNLMQDLVDDQFNDLLQQDFDTSKELEHYINLLPNGDSIRMGYEILKEYPDHFSKQPFKNLLKKALRKGRIDVNIMAKVDKQNYTKGNQALSDEFNDALAAFRGFAMSKVEGALVLSAGMNPKLYSYIAQFPDFLPDANLQFRKELILKVSDFRSAAIQARFLAKKGLWVSEFRIESGLNCGGHAFATEGFLLGPILEEFKQERKKLRNELFELASKNWGDYQVDELPQQRITVQGGIGTSQENSFLLNYYHLDGTGWGSPFLLVPEATNVDDRTLASLTTAKEDDFYLSNASPLGILFNNFKGSSIFLQQQSRIAKGKPGSPCTKKYLCNNTEFTDKPICTASRKYQNLKIQELNQLQLSKEDYQQRWDAIVEKICLCEGLSASAYLKNDLLKPKENSAVSICPGPNLAYFSQTYSLHEMIDHIYGREDLLPGVNRPHFFIKELQLYLNYFRKEVDTYFQMISDKKQRQLQSFKSQLLEGIQYYRSMFATGDFKQWFNPVPLQFELDSAENTLLHTFV